MRKSSLGKRKTSVCPVRLSSLGPVGELPERSVRQSRSSAKKSQIPRPTRNRTRSSSPTKDASKPVIRASVRRSRSNSNLPHAGTPMATPQCWLGSIPQTAQSSRSTVFGSRGHGLTSKPVLKDTRPLSNKQFQSAAAQKVQNYFLQVEDRDLLMNAPHALSTRSLTLKMFVEMTSHLLSHFFPKYIINMRNYADEIPVLTKKLGYPGSVKKSWLITANSCHSWPNVVGLLSWLVDLVRCVKIENLTNIMFNQEYDEEVPENFLDSKAMLSYYFKTYELFNKDDGENIAVEDSKMYQEIEKKCKISEKDVMSMTKEVEKWKIQVEAAVREEEAAQLAIAEQETAVRSFQNDLSKLQNFVQEQYTYQSELADSINKWSSKLNGLSESIESAKADILRMRLIVDNQSITLEDRKEAEKECRELEESIEMDQACCDAYLKSVYADDLQIAKLVNESKGNNVAYSAALIEYTNMVPELKLLNMPVNALHKDVDQTMQDVLKQLDNIRTRLKTQLLELETELEENEKIERRTLELKSVADEEYYNAARRVEEIQVEIAKLKEVRKQEKEKLQQELKRVQDECARRVEINSVLQEEKRKLKEALEIGEAIKADMLDTAKRVRERFAELDAMYNDLMKTMMAVNAAREESVKRFFKD